MNGSRQHAVDRPAAAGFCTACGTVHTLGAGSSRRHALELMAELETRKNLHPDGHPACSTDYLWGRARGQMFGVLECEDRDGQRIVLKAFSGQYNSRWNIDGWVPPILDVEAFCRISAPVDRQIKQLDRKIAEQGRRPEWVRQRKALSQELMRQIHGLYRLTGFGGETRLLTEVFLGNGIPTGAGDCCAPKLLNFAARQGLKPLGLSEFYWGRENRSGTRRHKEFYPACSEKCRPLLGFMLCGLHPRPALQVVFEDDDLVVVNKPSGMLAVPGREPWQSLRDLVLQQYPGAPSHPEVHRLDMDTSGLMAFARNKEAHRDLSRQFHDRQTEKRYIALLDGDLPEESGTIELPFRLDVDRRPLQIYDPVNGKIGITHWTKLSAEAEQTRVEFRPVTGRTHQLRVHAASRHGLGIPIVGDRLYGSGTTPGELKLHASFLGITHPRTGQKLQFRSDPLF